MRMTWEEFLAVFKPITNPLDDNASFDGLMFETYGEEIRFVQQHGANGTKVWTLQEEDGVQTVANGMHFVNRLGYFITQVPAIEGAHIIVGLNDDDFPDRESIVSVQMQDIVGDYDNPDDVEEWGWIKANASYAHVRNGQEGVWEFVLNLSREFEDVPAKLESVLLEAQAAGIGYLLFHQGT